VKQPAILFVALLVLGACATPRRTAPVTTSADVPAVWSVPQLAAVDGQSRATSLVAWWGRFDDPVLTGLIGDAMSANTSILSARAAITQARALRDVAAAALQPALVASTSARRQTQGLGNGTASAANSFQAGVDGSWTLDVYGGNASALSASQAAVWSRIATLGDIQTQIAAETASGYIVVRAAQARIAITRANLASQSDTAQIARWRRMAGLASAIETEQADALVEQTRASIPPLQTAIETAAHGLAILTDRPPAALNPILLAPRAVPQDRALFTLAIPAETLRQRADVRTAEYGVLEAMGRLGQADAATRPGFSLGGSVGLSSLRLGNLLDGQSVLSSLFGTITLPVFDGGASRAQVGAQEAALEQARLAHRAAILRALGDVENALVALRDDTARLVALRAAAGSAARAADLARLRYRAGLVDFQVVLETGRTVLATQDATASAQAAISTGQVTLYKALGGGWTAGPDLPALPPRQSLL
jgi:outer membrane protein, multidrug efflux system